MTDAWEWWAGRHEEWFESGPFSDREEAVAVGKNEFDGDGFFVVEAQKPAVRLCAETLITQQYFDAEELFDFDHSEPDRLADATDADKELQDLLDAWVEKWSHTFVAPTMFAASRNMEWIAGENDDE